LVFVTAADAVAVEETVAVRVTLLDGLALVEADVEGVNEELAVKLIVAATLKLGVTEARGV
jgi:hypothetical protein